MFSLSPARPGVTQLAVCAVFAALTLLLPGLASAQEIPAITDLRIENGELRWTAPANVSRYGVQYYTGETTDRTQFFGGCAQAGMDRRVSSNGVVNYCGWEEGSIRQQAGVTERLRNGWSAPDTPTLSYVVYSYNATGQRSAVSNVAIYPGYSIPVPVITSLPSPVQGVVQLEVGDTVRFTLQNMQNGFIGSAFSWHWDTSLLQCSGYPDFDSPEFRCTARRSGESDVSITLFGGQANESSRESNRIRVRVESDAPPVILPRITDLRIKNGELQWTAPANVSRYSIRFYTGETSSRSAGFSGCGYDYPQERNRNGNGYCAGEALSITRNSGHGERLRISLEPMKSFVVSYFDGNGNQSEVSNVAVWRNVLPPGNLQLWGPSSERFYRLKVGEHILLTGGAEYSSYPVLTNFKRDQLDCRSVPASYDGSETTNAKWVCTALSTGNGNSELYFTVGEQQSQTVVIQVDPASANVTCGFRPVGGGWQCEEMTSATCKAQGGSAFTSRQRCWNAAPTTPPSPTSPPPAGYEDEVLTNIEAYRNPFPDTSMQTLAGKAASELYRRAVIGGFPDGEFKGGLSVNRAEAAKFLILASIHKEDFLPELSNGGRFPDVLDGQWYTKYVIVAANKGIISGHPDGTFRPADTVNTAEFLKMLAKTFDLDVGLSHSYTDIPGGSWYAPYAGIAQRYSLFPSRTTRLYPERALTREEVAVAIYQYLQARGNPPTEEYPVGLRSLITNDDPSLGSKKAPVTIVEFLDYQCPFCARHATGTFTQIKNMYIDTQKVRYIVRDFPLAFHTNAQKAAEASECADEQGIYWKMHDILFSRQSEWSSLTDPFAAFVGYADDANLSKQKKSAFYSCLDKGTFAAEVRKDMEEGQESGISGTPGFWVIGPDGNGEMISGAYPFETFQRTIEKYLP